MKTSFEKIKTFLLFYLFSELHCSQAIPTTSRTASNYTISPTIPGYTTTTSIEANGSPLFAITEKDDLYDESDCVKCNTKHCMYNGECCLMEGDKFCMCRKGYRGKYCEQHDPAESKYRMMTLTLVTSLASLFIIILALALLLSVIYFVLKKGKRSQMEGFHDYDSVDRELYFVHGELHKLTQDDKMCSKKRLSKMIEATARAALLTFPDLGTSRPSQVGDNGIFTDSKITRRQSEPGVMVLPKDDPFKVERTTQVLYYNKPGRVQMVKRDLRKLLSH